MNTLLNEVLQWLQNNAYRRASFDRILGIVPSASTYEQLNELLNKYPGIFRPAVMKGGLQGLALQDEVNIAELLANDNAPAPLTSSVAQAPKIPTVTEDDVEREIQSEYYLNLGQATHMGGALDRVTICIITLRNEYTVIGKSACVYPEIFDAAKGMEIARKDAIRQVWQLLGFRLADQRAISALEF